MSDDSSLLAAGFSDGNLRVWSLTPQKLREMKSVDDLEIIDKEAGGSEILTSIDLVFSIEQSCLFSAVLRLLGVLETSYTESIEQSNHIHIFIL